VADIKELFGEGSLSGEEFAERLAEAGLVILEGRECDYVPVSRAEALASELQSVRADFEERLSLQRASSALKLELTRYGAINPALAESVVGYDGICGSDEDVRLAAEGKVKRLMESDPYMFVSKTEPSFSTGCSHAGSAADPDSMSDSEYYSYRKMM